MTVESPELAEAYTIGFDQLWETGDVMKSGRVEPRRVGGRRARHLGCQPLIDVEVVDRSRSHVHEHLPVARSRVWNLLVAQNLGPAAFVDDDCMHGASSP